MPNLFGIDIAGVINGVLGPQVLPARLQRITTGARTSGALTAGPATTTTAYETRGWIDNYDDRVVDGTRIRQGDRRVMLIAQPLTGAGVEPRTDDRIVIESQTLKIINAKRDPAGATWECQCR